MVTPVVPVLGKWKQKGPWRRARTAEFLNVPKRCIKEKQCSLPITGSTWWFPEPRPLGAAEKKAAWVRRACSTELH